MSLAELSGLLADRPDTIKPSLLGWLARHCDAADWDLVLQAAALFGGLEPPLRWPVIGAAVDEVAVARGLQRPGSGYRRPGRATEEEAAWLLPETAEEWRPELRDAALASLGRVLRAGQPWYAAMLLSHIGPYLGHRRSRAGRLLQRLAEEPWRSFLTTLLHEDPAASAEVELNRAHPLTARFDEAARGIPDVALARFCRLALNSLYSTEERAGGLPMDREPRPRDVTTTLDPASEAGNASSTLWVNSGLADPVGRRPLPSGRGLRTDTDYLFWFEISDELDPDSTERAATVFEVPEDATAGATLQVKVIGLPDQLTVRPESDTGELMLRADGRVEVARQPDGSPTAGIRLYFPIRTPRSTGRHRLRCNIYYQGRLLQSRTVQAMVDETERVQAWAVETTVDFLSGQALDPAALHAMQPVDLSIMVDDREPPGGFTSLITARGDVVAGIGMRVDQLQGLVQRTRNALRSVSYDADANGFRYDGYNGNRSDPGFFDHVTYLATRGYDAWVEIGGRIAETFERTGRVDLLSEPGPPGYENDALWRLSAWLQRPRVIELANTADARILIPASMIYDHPLAFRGPYRICGDFLNALNARLELSELRCFHDRCASYAVEEVICPSGFWGFRHLLGTPQSVGQAVAPDGVRDIPLRTLTITHAGRPRVAVGQAGEFRHEHPRWVSELGDGTLPVREDAAALLHDLRQRDPEPHLVYFYCHGAFAEGLPVLHFDAAGRDTLAATDVSARVRWPTSRPLVVLNACGSIATEPEHASSFIDALIRRAGASGMVGTEIVTYESLAADFGRHVLTEFVGRGRPIGEAMRSARLALLAEGNPMGLIYTAYAPPHLTMRATA